LEDQVNVAAPAVAMTAQAAKPIAVRLSVESFIVKSFMGWKL
jgi:hypothetical protein